LFIGKMNLELKKKIMKCLVWSASLYAAEMWTLTQTDRRLEAFEIWIWRRMENTELYFAKETTMDLPCFEIRRTFAWNY